MTREEREMVEAQKEAAGRAGDDKMVGTCNRAIAGSAVALATCKRLQRAWEREQGPYTLVNSRTGDSIATRYVTLDGAVARWYALGGRSQGWRISDGSGSRVGP